MSKLKLYLDCCCFNRPYDDLSQEKVRHECEAVLTIIRNCEIGQWDIVGSDVLDDEINRIMHPVKKQKVAKLYSSAVDFIEITDKIVARAKEFQNMQGIKPFDALHLASAELGRADVLLTTDKKFLNNALASNAKIRVANPAIWLMEVLFYE